MKKRVLVVGGAGYIGGCVTDYLSEQRIPFTVYDNLTYENQYLKAVDFVFGDVRDRKKLQDLFRTHTHVIWLAALVGDGACSINPELTREINQESVAWMAKHFDGRIVFTSTCSVYGMHDGKIHEGSPTNPLSVYAQTKLNSENYLKDKRAIIYRLGTAYGIGDTYSRIRMDLAVNYMTMNAIRYKKLTVFGGDQWRPFIHVKDIGKVIVDNLDTRKSGIYNLAAHNSTIKEIANKIRAATKCAIAYTEQKFQDNRNYNADTEKAIRDGIFDPRRMRSIEDGIDEVRALVISHRIKDLESEYYSNHKYLLRTIAEYERSHMT